MSVSIEDQIKAVKVFRNRLCSRAVLLGKRYPHVNRNHVQEEVLRSIHAQMSALDAAIETLKKVQAHVY